MLRKPHRRGGEFLAHVVRTGDAKIRKPAHDGLPRFIRAQQAEAQVQRATGDGVRIVVGVGKHAQRVGQPSAHHHDWTAVQPLVQDAQHLARRRFDRLDFVDAHNHRLVFPPSGVFAQPQHFGDWQLRRHRIVPIELADARQGKGFGAPRLANNSQRFAPAHRHGRSDEKHQALAVHGNVGRGRGKRQHAAAFGLLTLHEPAQQLGLARTGHAINQSDAAAGVGVLEDVFGIGGELGQLVAAPGEMRRRVALRAEQRVRVHARDLRLRRRASI